MSPRREPPVIVIDRHGNTETTEQLSGWRRWVAMGAGYLVVALMVLVGLAVALGLAMTVLMVLAVAVPLAAALWLIAYVTGYTKMFRRGSTRYSDMD
ncbi:hypothetical protein W911_12155 [Hyphomicrobium nitrativorans NL23]|uniref:Uncharacterized protein n=1 Tax=Hyphomicrobium nitrativorans NL23 TaxID=1029756 RepID=V5SJI0_9HYPH|nr:hypothetical protein [Hyphomicrobium nitrativorans]AHB50250.1 hypothetical protein W911_12155 [Hyphomicrobium nitrativorans NL23]